MHAGRIGSPGCWSPARLLDIKRCDRNEAAPLSPSGTSGMMPRDGAQALPTFEDRNEMAAKKPDPIDPAATGDEDVVEVVDIETETFEIEEDAADRYGYVDPLGPGLFARAAIEALGTFVLVLVTLATALYLPLFGVDTLGAVLAPGLVLVGLMVAFGHVSGGTSTPP